MAAPVGPVTPPGVTGPTSTPGTGSGPASSSTATTSTTSSAPTTSSTSNSPPPTTSSSSSSTAASSSSTLSSSTKSTSTTLSTGPPTTARSLPGTLPTTAGGGVTTQFTTAFVAGTDGVGPSATAAAGNSKSFFANKGAVAGTFSVVGLVALVLLIALITNGLRRRRARKFDRELAAATLEAASAPKPIFLDDDDDVGGGYGARGGYGAGGMGSGGGGGEYNDYTSAGGFSDVSSHGTYGQPPMSVSGHGPESYGMRELGHPSGVGPGEIFDPYTVAGVGAAAGAAGIGVARARSQKAVVEGAGPGGYGAGLQEGGAPYAAFAAPQGGVYDPYANNGAGNYQRNADILEAAGMGTHAAGAGALARNQSMSYASSMQYPGQQQQQYGQQQLHHRTTPSQEYASLGRNKSIGGMGAVEEYDAYPAADQGNNPMSATSATSGATQYFSPVAESYASHYQGQGQQPQAYQPYPAQQGQLQPEKGHQRGYSAASGGEGDDMDDAYGGYVAEGGTRLSGVPNPFAVSEPGHSQLVHGRQESGSDAESRYSDEEVGEEPRRVLKVANE